MQTLPVRMRGSPQFVILVQVQFLNRNVQYHLVSFVIKISAVNEICFPGFYFGYN